MTHANTMRILKNYVRGNSSNLIILSIPTIQFHLHNILGITEGTFTNSQNTYMILLHRIYLLTFMLYYKMPLQQKGVRGKRNCATSVGCFAKKGWYSYLSHREQKILQRDEINLSESSIPDNMIHGVCREDFTDFTKVQHHDILNCNMFRDRSVDTSLFQQKIHTFMCHYSQNKEGNVRESKHTSSDVQKHAVIQEVPTISFLLEQVQKYMVTMNTSFCPNHRLPWGEIFYSLVNLCGLKNEFSPSSLPITYTRDKVCGHIFHFGLEETATHAMPLTMLEGSKDLENALDSHVPSFFIYCMVFQNHICDLGLQFKASNDISSKKSGVKSIKSQSYTANCMCPCSKLFDNWHRRESLDKLPNWRSYPSEIYQKTSDFIHHLHVMNKDYYHEKTLRVVQSNYSLFLAKFRFRTSDDVKSGSDILPFSSIHKGVVMLPFYVFSSSTYYSFDYKNDCDGTKITLCRTNLLR